MGSAARLPLDRSQYNYFAGYPILTDPVDVDRASADRLRSLLLHENTYLWNVKLGCIFEPGVAVRFYGSSGDPLDVLFCFSCSELMVRHGDNQLGVEELGAIRDELLQIFSHYFPMTTSSKMSKRTIN